MAVNKNTYGLPDETLQLIGNSPELNFGRVTNDPGLTSMISALRGERSSNNPGVRLLANRANGAGVNFNRKPAAASNRFPILKMPKGSRSEVTLPGGETQPPYEPPYVPPYVPPFFPPVVDDDVVDDDVIDDDVVDDDVVDDDVIDDETEDTVEDDLDIDLDTDLLDDLVIPDEKEKTGTVDIEVVDGLEAQDDGTTDGILDLINAGFDDSEKTGTVDIEVVDPNEESPQDDGTTGDILDLINSGLPGDQDDFIQDDGTTDGIQDIIDSMGGGSGGSDGGDDYADSDFGYDFGGGTNGGGKYFNDQSAATMAFAKGGKVTPDRLAGPNPAGPDDGFAALKNGEFVLNKEAAEAIGYELLNRLNRSRP